MAKKQQAKVKRLKVGKVDIREWVLPNLEQAAYDFNIERVVLKTCQEVLEYALDNDTFSQLPNKFDPEHPLQIQLEVPLGDGRAPEPAFTYDFKEALQYWIDYHSDSEGRISRKAKKQAIAMRVALLELASQLNEAIEEK